MGLAKQRKGTQMQSIASDVRVGDTIQHPAGRWAASEVTAIEPVGNYRGELKAYRFTIRAGGRRTSRVVFAPSAPVIITGPRVDAERLGKYDGSLSLAR